MKKVLLVCLVALFAITSQSYASTAYTIDDAAVEAVFDNSVSVIDLASESDSMVLENAAMLKAGKSPIAAFVICWLLGGIAIHRVYLGGTPLLVLGYILTIFGIFGLVPLVDWIVLLVDVFRNDLGKHEGSDAFFMW
jgi:hypothetical protein